MTRRRFALALPIIGTVALYLLWRALAGDGVPLDGTSEWQWEDRQAADSSRGGDPPRQYVPPPKSAVLDTGQEIVGDFRILSFDDVLHEAGTEAAMRVAIEKYPDKLEELLESRVFDANMRLHRARAGGWDMPIVKAMRHGTEETFAILMAAGADPGLRDGRGENALHHAAYGGLMGAIEIFLEAGADPSNVADDGSTPLRMAATGGHLEVVERLLAAGADPEHSALWAAAAEGHDDIVRRLAAAGSQVEGSPGQEPPGIHCPMWQAALGGHLTTVELLLELGAPPRCDGVSQPIDIARSGGHDQIVELLSRHGAG